MKPVDIAEQHEIGREIERVEIAALVGQPLGRNAHLVEAEQVAIRRQKWGDLRDQAVGVECRDEHRARGGARQRRHTLSRAPHRFLADPGDLLDIDPGNVERRQVEQLGKPFGGALRVDDRHLAIALEAVDQRAAGRRGERVRQRLVERVAAADIVERVDAQGHPRILRDNSDGARRRYSVMRGRRGRVALRQQPERDDPRHHDADRRAGDDVAEEMLAGDDPAGCDHRRRRDV